MRDTFGKTTDSVRPARQEAANSKSTSPMSSATAVPIDSVAEIDQIVGDWNDLRKMGLEQQAQAKVERGQFLEDFQTITDSVIRPAMQAAVDRLGKDGAGGLIEEREESPLHRPRITLWMSLDGDIAGTPRQDLNPYLQLDADVELRRIDVWEGDMWEKGGTSRSTSPWELGEVTTEIVTERILGILRRATTHGAPA